MVDDTALSPSIGWNVLHLFCQVDPDLDTEALTQAAKSAEAGGYQVVPAALLGHKQDNLRQRLREFYKEAPKKAGEKRQTLNVEVCFGSLLRWVLGCWHADQIAVALDATSLGDRFVVLTISVLYRGCAIPVAWCVTQAAQKRAWRREWLRLLRLLAKNHYLNLNLIHLPICYLGAVYVQEMGVVLQRLLRLLK